MKKSFPVCIAIAFCCLFTQQVVAQTETFDIATYTMPDGFTKTTRQGVLSYMNFDTAAGKFCVIVIYASNTSTGDPARDFTKEWKELVVTPYKADANPQTETESTDDGWKAVTGAAGVKESGLDCYLILTVFSGFGRSLSIRCAMNDPSYATQIDALFKSMELAKTRTPNTNNNVATVETTATKGKFGLMMYTAPSGWSEQVFSDGVVFKPLDLPAGEHLAIQIMRPLNSDGSIEQALSKSYDEAALMYQSTKMFYAGGAEYQKTEAQRSFNGWEYISGKGGVQVENGTAYKSELGLDLFVIKINNRFERVAVLKSRKYCNNSRYYATDRQVYNYAIDNFLFSLRFTDGDAPVLQPGTAKGNGVVGVWQGTIQGTGAATGVKLDVFCPIFLTNGQVYFGPKFPTEGLNGLDTRIPSELHRRDWGTYTFSNGSGMIKMPYANIPMRMEGNKLIIAKNQMDWTFYKLASVDGATFNGTYNMREDNGKIPSIIFTKDGRFTDNGAIKVLYHEYITCLNPGLLPGSGVYEVTDYSILFTYTDGRKVKLAFLGTEYNKADPSPAVLRMSFDDNPMTRQ